MPLTENVLAFHSGLETVKPGDLVFAKLDLVMSTDITTPMSIPIFEQMGLGESSTLRGSFWSMIIWFRRRMLLQPRYREQ